MKGRVILIPTDFSKNAEVALTYAINLATDFQARLIVLHAYRLLQTTIDSIDQSPFSIKNQWDRDTQQKFRRLESKYLKDAGIDYSFEVDVGFAADAINSSALANKVDMVVIGAAGAGTINQIVGSTTLKILNMVHCPVMVIPSEANYCDVSKVTFAYDTKRVIKKEQIHLLAEYVKTYNAKLEILSVSTRGRKSETTTEQKDEFDKFLVGTDHFFTTISTKDDNIADSILGYIDEKSSNVLVALKRDHSFVEKVFNFSITRKLAIQTGLPLLVIHEN